MALALKQGAVRPNAAWWLEELAAAGGDGALGARLCESVHACGATSKSSSAKTSVLDPAVSGILRDTEMLGDGFFGNPRLRRPYLAPIGW